jgi:hypothetical protein
LVGDPRETRLRREPTRKKLRETMVPGMNMDEEEH